MDSKTLATIMVVFICVLLFPVAIGIISGIFGLIGGVLGGIFGIIGGLFGAIMGAIGAIFGAIFRVFGWLFGDRYYDWDWPGHFFSRDILTGIVLVLIIVLIARSKTPRARG